MTDATAYERALFAEIAERTKQMQNSDAEAGAMADILFNGDVPEDAPIKQKRAPIKQVNHRLEMPEGKHNPNSRYIELPADVAAFVQESTACKGQDINTGFSNAAEYFSVFKQLNTHTQALPVNVPSPLGWIAEFVGKSSHIDVADLLNQMNEAARRPEMLQDLVRWACTVQREYEANDVRSALSRLEQRGKAADERLQNSIGAALLNKFNTLIALLQTQAFSGKPELLVQCLIEDWRWLEAGVAYKTPLSELSAYPALFDPRSMLPGNFISAGTLAEFMQKHRESLIDTYRADVSLRDTEFGTVNVYYTQKHTWVRAERTLFDADAPVIIQLGFQEQLEGGSSISSEGSTESWRDVTALTLTQEGDILEIQPGNIPADSAVAKPVRDAVKALQLLNEAGK